MKRDDAEEFTQSLGQIVGGSWRQIALAKRLGVPKALGLEVDEWVNKRLGGYVKQTIEDRRKDLADIKAEGISNRAAADLLGVDEGTIRNDLRAENSAVNGLDGGDDAENSANLPLGDAVDLVDRGVKAKHRHETVKANEQRAKDDLHRPVASSLEGLIRGDFRELSRDIPSESVELVFTDPPYDRNSLPLYEAAAIEAKRILKPGGSMVCYVGQILLPEALASMSKHLRYWWTFACVHDGGNQIMQKYGIRCGWKPMMWFVKGSRGDVANVVLDTVSGVREKSSHEWQQAEAEAAYFIEKLCPPDGIVVDFFAGGGTTCLSAEQLGRRWLAYEVDATHYEAAARRIAGLREAA